MNSIYAEGASVWILKNGRSYLAKETLCYICIKLFKTSRIYRPQPYSYCRNCEQIVHTSCAKANLKNPGVVCVYCKEGDL